MNLISNLEAIIRESVKPMERIDGIKIIQMGGLNGSSDGVVGHSGVNGTTSSNLADQVVNGALRYRAQAPLLDALLKEVGITGGDINGLTQCLVSETKLN